jgi:hypothetical protein
MCVRRPRQPIQHRRDIGAQHHVQRDNRALDPRPKHHRGVHPAGIDLGQHRPQRITRGHHVADADLLAHVGHRNRQPTPEG